MNGRDDPLACLADKRWHWLQNALTRIYGELEPGDEPLAINVMAASGGQVVTYGCAPTSDTVYRRLVTDPGKARRAMEEAFTDMTVPDSP